MASFSESAYSTDRDLVDGQPPDGVCKATLSTAYQLDSEVLYLHLIPGISCAIQNMMRFQYLDDRNFCEILGRTEIQTFQFQRDLYLAKRSKHRFFNIFVPFG